MFLIAFVEKNDTQNHFCYIFPKLTAELALDILDDPFYCTLVTEHMINSELQPLPCCCTERELLSPSCLFFSSFLACCLEAYGKVFALFGVTLHLL